jgi:hypothetical protein
VAAIKLVAGDSRPYIMLTLTNANGTPLDVSGSTTQVFIQFRQAQTPPTLATILCTKPNGGADGVVQFNLSESQSSVPAGNYEGAVVIQYSLTDQQTMYDTIPFIVRAPFSGTNPSPYAGTTMFNVSVSATLPAVATDFTPAGVTAATNRFLLAAAPGGTTLNSLALGPVADGSAFLLRNTSTTDNILIPNGGPTTTGMSFATPAGAVYEMPPQTQMIIVAVNNQWTI